MTKGEVWFRRMVTGVLAFVVLLVFVGAIVRATGAGLGCPDWPKCWGQLIPPWKVEQVDLSKINYERFEKKAERLGRDPSTVTPEHILENFNPVHTWTEFVNRLTSLPVGFFALGAVVTSFLLPMGKSRRKMIVLSFLSLFIILVNAVMGAMVVYSGLKPGIITLHLALAMILIFILVYCRREVSDQPAFESGRRVAPLVWGLLALVVVEGILGSQVRELTDMLARSHKGEIRSQWIWELEQSAVYLVHRSFSWLIVILMGVVGWKTWKLGIFEKRAKLMTGLVFAMMVMGVILAQVGVYPWVQVLHVGVAAIMVTLLCDWSLVLQRARS
ncbi:COX15/CtaA family protein [Roseibacillus persicicus]|nr:COX15/CtaA family protein [Roseibacillus persicicus]